MTGHVCRAGSDSIIYEVLGSRLKEEAWKTTKYIAARGAAGFEGVRNQQLERKDEGQKTVERNMCSDLNEKGGCSSQYIIDLENRWFN